MIKRLRIFFLLGVFLAAGMVQGSQFFDKKFNRIAFLSVTPMFLANILSNKKNRVTAYFVGGAAAVLGNYYMQQRCADEPVCDDYSLGEHSVGVGLLGFFGVGCGMVARHQITLWKNSYWWVGAQKLFNAISLKTK